ncbi:hypothetical protein ABPG74_014950 [Tetrahymena malaccensis]
MIQQVKSQYNQPFLNDRVSSVSSISSQEMENCIIIRPKREIVFKYLSNKDITADFEIINQSHTKRYLYRILCTSSKSYKVEPYKGEINPNQKIQIKSILISKGADIEKRMKDQFKVEYICLEEDLVDQSLAWSTFPKKEIRLSISVMFQKQNAKSNSPSRYAINGITNSVNNDFNSYANKSQKSFYSPNQSQMQNNSQLSYTKAINSQMSPRSNQFMQNANVMNNSNEFNLDNKYPEESKFTPDSLAFEQQSKTLKLTNSYSQNSSDKYNMAFNATEENYKYQQKFNMLRKRQDEQVELIKSYKEDIKKFHNEISKLKFIFRKNESSTENQSESKNRFLLQPYQLSILIFAFLVIGALVRI